MTTSPQREQVRAPKDLADLEAPLRRPAPDLVERSARTKAALILNIALIGAVAVAALGYASDDDEPVPKTGGQPSGVASTLATADESAPADSSSPEAAATTTDPTTDPITEPTPSDDVAKRPPKVEPAMSANFAQGDPWPYAAGFREAGSPGWPLGVVDRVMTHGPPRAPNSVSWLERWMETDVRTIGARVLFAPNRPGAAVLTAWQTSVLELSGQEQPLTGMRLIALPGQWRLVAIERDGKSILASGTYAQRGNTARFNLVRQGQTAWVVDPIGSVTGVRDARIAALAGPWASWELRESTPGKRPAAFQEIWAG